jgi:hypothetical protein
MKKPATYQSTAIARLFSSAVVRELATKGESPLFAKLIREAGLAASVETLDSVAEVYDEAFRLLRRRANRHEYIYKAAITKKILLGRHSLNTASMITEFRVGTRKADIVILNGTGTAYEIKSERDSLTRLEDQVTEYLKVFASVNIIVGENHLESALASAPSDVGVLKLCEKHRISTIREATNRPGRTESDAIFSAITQLEATEILRKAGYSIPEVPNTERYAVLRELFNTLPSEVAHMAMVETLKSTRNLQSFKQLLDDLPESLYSASLSVRLRKRDQERLAASLKTPVSKALCWG